MAATSPFYIYLENEKSLERQILSLHLWQATKSFEGYKEFLHLPGGLLALIANPLRVKCASSNKGTGKISLLS